MMDISDGLGRDAARMASASSVRFELDAATFPKRTGIADWRRAAADGEDYELLFTAPATSPVPSEIPSLKTRITRIGQVTKGAGCIIIAEGKAYDAAEMGWDHGR
jgi:thiamine-monophosphate kinase